MHAKHNRSSDCGTPQTSTNVAGCIQNAIETVIVGLLGLQLMLLNACKHNRNSDCGTPRTSKMAPLLVDSYALVTEGLELSAAKISYKSFASDCEQPTALGSSHSIVKTSVP